MRFLVTGEYVEVGSSVDLGRQRELLERVILPSWNMLIEWEQAGRVSGGVFVGDRSVALLLEASSHEEAGELLASLPFWSLMKWMVRPLQTIRSVADSEQKAVRQR
jgi:hypothetical protein